MGPRLRLLRVPAGHATHPSPRDRIAPLRHRFPPSAFWALVALSPLDQAYWAIDWCIRTVVGGVTPLSFAMTTSGVTGRPTDRLSP